MALTVAKLRDIAEDILAQLECFEDDEIIHVRCNTYGMGCQILETYDGFLDYTDIQIEGPDGDEEDDE